MHLGRFHKAIEQLANEYETSNHAQLFDNLINALNTVASQPGNADQAAAYKSQLENFRQVLLKSEMNSPRPVMQAMLASIEAEKYIGEQLFDRVMEAISSNPATPSLAAQELQKLRDDTVKFYKNIVAVNTAFSALGVEYESLDAGEGELGILIPREDNASTLSHLSKEFKDWSNILSPLTEIFDPEATPLQIRTCATTDWMIYLAATYGVLRGVADCLKGVNLILREIVEMRGLIEQIAKKSNSAEAIEILEKDNKQKLSNDIRSLAERLVEENYKGVDQARKNELKNAVDVALKTIAKKVSEGAKIELKYLAPQRPSSDTGVTKEDAEKQPTEQEILALRLEQEISLIDFSDSKNHMQAFLENEMTEVGHEK